ncbi:hypothetical protein B0T16DRAFT_462455 [Cercophora newfieldiana]|uniref:Uncharacterized protein n=1 Tax=Cercophora newfieldiana TaxID=92897 RepID=A0AA39XR60_9PEZI|nr:hypothetical protein B0T16DRAFT_462455 [Cercophora newfieldiana]
MATTGTLLGLPPQPLPKGDLVDSVFVTIWWFVVTCFALVLSWQLCVPYVGAVLGWLFPRERPTKEIFRDVCWATGVFAFWYFFVVVDRWIHYDQRASVVYGYIVFLTLIEALRVLSAVIFAWGNYKIVWVEIEIRFDPVKQGRLWAAAKVALFLLSLVSIFYAVLYLALAGVWLDFKSLNSIADIATKRTSFEIATAALLTAFAGLAFGSAVYALKFQAEKVDGKGNSAWKNRWLLLTATFIFFLRSLVEFALLLRILGPDATRGSLTLARDVSYGLLSCFYLLAISVYAPMISAPDDMGKADTQDVRANVRRYIDKKLNAETDEARRRPRPFLDIMEEVEEAYKNDTDGVRAKFHAGSTLSDEVNMKAIEEFFLVLRKNFGHLGTDEQTEPAPTSPTQSTVSLFSTLGQRMFGAASDPNMRQTARKTSNWSLRDAFQTGRKSAPPNMPTNNDPNTDFGGHDGFDTTDTISEYTRTDVMSRRDSLARSHRHSSAPVRNRPMETHFEEMPGANGVGQGGRVRDSRVVTDPTVLHSAQQRWELGDPEPPSPQELGHESPRRPAYPLAPTPRSLRRQRREGSYEMEPYRAYSPQAPHNSGPLNTYAERHRSVRRQQAASEIGVPGTPFLQQATPRLAEAQVNRQYTATPDQAHHQQQFIPVPAAEANDVPSGPPPVNAVAPTAVQDVAEPVVGQTGPPRPTMQFQGRRSRRPVAAQGSPSPQSAPPAL